MLWSAGDAAVRSKETAGYHKRTAVDRCKNLPFPRKTHKNRRKTQNLFVPYLTSARGADAHIRPQIKGEKKMEFAGIPVGFGMALSQNEAAMIRFAHLDEKTKRDILAYANNARSEKDMYTLVT